MCIVAFICHSKCEKIIHVVDIIYLPLTSSSWLMNSGHQVWLQVPLCTAQSCQLSILSILSLNQIYLRYTRFLFPSFQFIYRLIGLIMPFSCEQIIHCMLLTNACIYFLLPAFIHIVIFASTDELLASYVLRTQFTTQIIVQLLCDFCIHFEIFQKVKKIKICSDFIQLTIREIYTRQPKIFS